MPTARVNGVELWYETAGQADPPILLIMGLSVSGRAWRFQVPALAERHRVVFYDNRGCGESEKPPPGYSIGDMADDAAALMDHLDWPQAHVIGVSMGGMIAQEVALRHRDRVLSLGLIATHAGGGLTSRHARPHLKALGHILQTTLRKGEGRIDAFENLLFPRDYIASCDREWLRDVLRRDYGSPPPIEGRRGHLRATFNHDTRDRLHTLEGLPTLIVRPGADILISPTASDELHERIPGSVLLRFDDAGHGVIRQSAEPLNAALLEHLRSTG